MGQAKRRKLAGDYPEQKPKPRTKGRIKPVVNSRGEYFAYFPGMFSLMAGMLMGSEKPGLKQMLREDEYDG
jgi:hypothetical protein